MNTQVLITSFFYPSAFHSYDLTCSQDEEEEGGGEDEEQPESAERKEHNTDGQTGEENVQSDTAVELAGEASERDQAKEVKPCLHSELHPAPHQNTDDEMRHGLRSEKVSPREEGKKTLICKLCGLLRGVIAS